MRQGDLLSPLLFCLAEKIISKAFSEGNLSLIQGSRNNAIPSHILYAEEIMLFCKGAMSNIHVLTDLFQRYSEASGHLSILKNPQFSLVQYQMLD